VFCAENGREPMALDDEAMTRISMMPYKGNIRELQNLVDRLALFSTTSTVTEFDVEQALGPATHDPSAHFTRCRPLADAKNELEKLYIETQLQLHGWDVPTTAAALGILPNNLHRKITQLSIERPHRKKAPDE
jgi:DNA-binding NtrC family response regulator